MDIDDSAERDARLLALGRIADKAALMESVVRSYVGALIGGPRATVVVAGQTMTWLIETALAIIKHNDAIQAPELGSTHDVERFVRSLKRSGELYRKRNDALHGVWAEEGIQFVSRYRQPNLIYNPLNLADLQQLGADLGTAVASLMNSGNRINGLVYEPPLDQDDEG